MSVRSLTLEKRLWHWSTVCVHPPYNRIYYTFCTQPNERHESMPTDHIKNTNVVLLYKTLFSEATTVSHRINTCEIFSALDYNTSFDSSKISGCNKHFGVVSTSLLKVQCVTLWHCRLDFDTSLLWAPPVTPQGQSVELAWYKWVRRFQKKQNIFSYNPSLNSCHLVPFFYI